jgi:hypothetical protein
MDKQRKENIENIINMCKNCDFNNSYHKILHKFLSERLLKKDIEKYVSISFNQHITQQKCQENKLSTLKTNLKKIIICNEVNSLFSEFFEKCQNTNKLSNNYTIALAQILYLFYIPNTLENNIKYHILSNMSRTQILKKIMPEYSNTNNFQNIFIDTSILEEKSFNNYDKIFDEIYDILTGKEYTMDELEVIFNYMKNIKYDVWFITFIKNLYHKTTNNLINNRKQFQLTESRIFTKYYQTIINNKNNKNNLNYPQFNNDFMNPNKDITSYINIYFSIKNYNKDVYESLQLFLNSYYQNINILDVQDNRDLLTIKLIGLISHIKTLLNNDNFINFSKMFYDKIKDYWKNICNTSGIYFKYEDYKNNSDIFTYCELYKFESWNMLIENYIYVNSIINDLFNYFREKQIKKTEDDKCKKEKFNINRETIPKAVKSKVWDLYIGKQNGIGKCQCCKTRDIEALHFECGHIISEAHGGKVKIDNLRPICSQCNRSMGTMNMDEFIHKYGF